MYECDQFNICYLCISIRKDEKNLVILLFSFILHVFANSVVYAAPAIFVFLFRTSMLSFHSQ